MFWGLLNRRERWGLSGRGMVVLFCAAVATAWVVVANIYPFLAITNRERTSVLVVEGWIGEHSMRAAIEEFTNEAYDCIISTGGPVNGSGGYTNDFQTSASVGADILRKLGAPAERVRMVPSRVLGRDRTYSAAIALREWFASQQWIVTDFNVLTEEAHARRTRLLYQMAFGDDVQVGVISIASPDYDGRRWWRSSAGVREVLAESIAYVYAAFFFQPEPS
jgi:hypothetical protein